MRSPSLPSYLRHKSMGASRPVSLLLLLPPARVYGICVCVVLQTESERATTTCASSVQARVCSPAPIFFPPSLRLSSYALQNIELAKAAIKILRARLRAPENQEGGTPAGKNNNKKDFLRRDREARQNIRSYYYM